MPRVPKALLGAVVAALVGAGLGASCFRPEPPTPLPVRVTINDSTKALLARTKKERDSYKALLDAAKQTGGKLVAGVQTKVKPDTVYLPAQETPTTTTPDSIRHAVLKDSTAGYSVTVEATAPPFPAPLKLGYTVVTPELHPEVGIVKRGEAYYAVVSLGGRQYEIEKSFYTPPKERPVHLVIAGGVEAEPSLPVPLPSIDPNVYAALQVRLKRNWSVEARGGLSENGPYVGAYVVKQIF